MADIAASLTLEFALRADQALKTLDNVRSQIGDIEKQVAIVGAAELGGVSSGGGDGGGGGGRSSGGGKSDVEIAAEATATIAAFRAASSAAESSELEKQLRAKLDFNAASQKAISLSQEELEFAREILATFKKIPYKDRAKYSKEEKNLWVSLEKSVRMHEKYMKSENGLSVQKNALLEAANKLTDGAIENFKSMKETISVLGPKVGLIVIGIDLLAKGMANAEKAAVHFRQAMWDASGATVRLSQQVYQLQASLGLSSENAVSVVDAMAKAGIASGKLTVDEVSTFAEQMGQLKDAYGVSAEASAEFVSAQLAVGVSAASAQNKIEGYAKGLHAAGMSGENATKGLIRAAEYTRKFGDATGKAGKDYLMVYGLMASAAKRTYSSSEKQMAITDELMTMVAEGGPKFAFFLGKGAIVAQSMEERFAQARNRISGYGKILENFKGLSLQMQEAKAKELGLSKDEVHQMAMITKGYKAGGEAMMNAEGLTWAHIKSQLTLSTALGNLWNHLSGLVSMLLGPLSVALGAVVATIGFAVGLANKFAKLLNGLIDGLGDGVYGLAGAFIFLKFTSKAAGTGMLQAFLSPFATIKTLIGGLIVRVIALGGAFKSLLTLNLGGFFTGLKASILGPAKATKEMADAAKGLTKESGEGAKGFMEKLSDGLKAIGELEGKKIALNMLMIGGALLALTAGLVLIAAAIKHFGITAGDFGMAAAAMAVAAAIMLGVLFAMTLMSTGLVALQPVLYPAALAMAVFGAALLIVAASGLVFAMAFEKIMAAWDTGKAWAMLGWMGVAGAAFLGFGFGLLLATPGLLAGGFGLMVAAAGIAKFGLILSLIDSSKVASLGAALNAMSGGMVSFALSSWSFLKSVLVTSVGITALAAAMLIFPNKWFADAANSMMIWSQAISNLPENSGLKMKGIKDTLKQIKDMPNLKISEIIDPEALNKLAIGLNRFTESISGLAKIDVVADRFSLAIDKIANAIERFKGFSEKDLKLAVSAAQLLDIQPISATSVRASPSIAVLGASNNDAEIVKILIEQNKLLTELRDRADNRSSLLNDLLSAVKTNKQDGYLGGNSLTSDSTGW